MLAIRIHENGGAEKLSVDHIDVPVPKAGELRIRVEAAGVNFVDTYFRSGLYKTELPLILGQEAAGIVTAVGESVTDFRVGDRVATPSARGAYAEEAIVEAAKSVQIPEGVDGRTAAALMVQGITAHYLACDTYLLKNDDIALVHAGAGGVGLLLTQIAKMRGARVIATVGTEEKAQLAREAGADAVCIYTKEDFTAAARAFTNGRGVDVAYDSVGKSTFEGTLKSLRPRGMFVSFGNASGAVPPFAPLMLSQNGSLFFTRPSLVHYMQTPAELRTRAADLFGWISEGKLSVRIGATYPLACAAEAQRALEGRLTTGKVLLLP
ncbi:MAG TPA: quinone oxidoreductase [Opitutus sp.]|nr:quinone oxidoreductase [Opitutus sp.]